MEELYTLLLELASVCHPQVIKAKQQLFKFKQIKPILKVITRRQHFNISMFKSL